MWRAVADVAHALGSPTLVEAAGQNRYEQFKSESIFEDRRRVANDVKKTALKGWVPNSGDETFGLDEE